MTYLAWEHLTWPEAEALSQERALGLIPTGSIEQHGPHLPLATDKLIAEELGRRIGAAISETVIVTPVVPGGLSDHHLAFPGTVTFSEELFGAALDAYVAALTRIDVSDVAIISGHGGNLGFLGRYESEHAQKGSAVQLIAHHDLGGYIEAMFSGARAGGFNPIETDVHAGGVETSQALAVFPELVRPFQDIPGYTAAEKGWLDILQNGTDALSPSGVLGNVEPATAEAGEAIFAHLTEYLVEWITGSLGFTRQRTVAS